MNSPTHETELNNNNNSAMKWLLLIFLVYLMLTAVSIIGTGFKIATSDQAKSLFEFAENPIAALVIGMTATALIQSSSTVSSIIVAMVAGGLPINIAIPMIMGANIGTSITSTLVSLGHIRDKDEFQKAFSAATVHDFFNVMAVLIFLPLEMMFGLLDKVSSFIVNLFSGGIAVSGSGFNPIKMVTGPVKDFVASLVSSLPEVAQGIILASIGLVLIIVSISLMGKIMRNLMVGQAKEILHKAIGKNAVMGISSGTVVTILVQSSSTTTSLMVPLVGTGVLRTRDVYPFTLGANIGTCITALIAALAATGEYAAFAMQIAIVHLCFNAMAVTLIYGVPLLREVPLKLSEGLSLAVADKKILGLAYIASLFFIVPLIALSYTAM